MSTDIIHLRLDDTAHAPRTLSDWLISIAKLAPDGQVYDEHQLWRFGAEEYSAALRKAKSLTNRTRPLILTCRNGARVCLFTPAGTPNPMIAIRERIATT